ncbi:hypothetical protein [Kitasatospora viridis]|nr:hypothetical protein [Kitasatospora viridis]
MVLPLGVVIALNRLDTWLDWRADRRQMLRQLDQLLRAAAAQSSAEPPTGDLFAIPRPPEDDPT